MTQSNLIILLAIILYTFFHLSDQSPPASSYVDLDRNCSRGWFSCNEGLLWCVLDEWVCDGDIDCEDGSDEENCDHRDCGPDSLSCAGRCVSYGLACNGAMDCTNGADEAERICNTGNTCPYFGSSCLTNTSICVAYQQLCDGNPDCPDRSDESTDCEELLEPGYTGFRLCDALSCEHACTFLPEGLPTCYCPPGSILYNDTKCKLANICNLTKPCSQTCVQTSPSGWEFTCSCMDSFFINPHNSSHCLIEEGSIFQSSEPYLIAASDQQIQSYNMEGQRQRSFSSSVARILPTVDYNTHTAYWISHPKSGPARLVSASLDHLKETETIELPYSIDNCQIAVDWVTGNIYFLNTKDEHIFVCSVTQPISCISLLQQNKPATLLEMTLDAHAGYIFYFEHGTYSKINRLDMDGTNYQNIVKISLSYAQGLTVDPYGERLYFFELHSGCIQSVDYRGKFRTKHFCYKKKPNMFEAAFFNDSLYISENKKQLSRLQLWEANPTLRVLANTSAVETLRVVHPLVQRTVSHVKCHPMNCQHICLIGSTKRVGTCFCRAGFILNNDSRTCIRPPSGDVYLLVSKGHPGEIKGIPLFHEPQEHYSPVVPIENLKGPRGLDYYRDTNGDDWIIYSHIGEYEIKAHRIRDGFSQVIFNQSVYNCEGLAIDWSNGNMLWTDDGYKTINIASLSPLGVGPLGHGPQFLRKVLVNGVTSHPRAIVVHEARSVIYWSVWEQIETPQTTYGKIETSWMDGSHREILYTGSDILWPNGITVDTLRDVIYYTEAFYDKIEAIQINGRIKTTVISGTGNQFGHPFSISLFEGASKDNTLQGRYLFVADYRSGLIYRYNLTSNQSEPVILHREKPPVLQVIVFNPLFRAGHSACSEAMCTDLCVSIPTYPHYKCLCPNGASLTADNHTCTDKANYTTVPSCAEQQFQCDNGICIVKKWVCDGDNDCHDNSDEKIEMCAKKNCSDGWFLCSNSSVCILSRWVCDGESDCPGGEDETPRVCRGRSCPSGQFLCPSGLCIPDIWRCDLDDDCHNGFDESDNCTYASCRTGVEFSCLSGRCIALEWACDGEDDCGDGSDEEDCSATTTPSTATKCAENEMQCSNETSLARCMPSRWRCDGDEDCPDGSDEAGCPPSIHRCGYGLYLCNSTSKCILEAWVCDGADDCYDGSDEANCDCPQNITSKYQQIRCITVIGKSDCVNKCDHNVDCISGQDELNCNHGVCANSGCSHSCTPTNTGFECSCPKGKELSSDHATCQDIDYCRHRGTCAHICHTTPRAYHCSCHKNWKIDHYDVTKCVYDKPAPPPFIIFSNKRSLKYMELNTTSIHENERKRKFQYLVEGFRQVLGLDFHYHRNLIFFTDIIQDTITRATLTYNAEDNSLTLSDQQAIITQGIMTPEGIAVDWINDKIYFVESTLNQIQMATLEGNMRTVVVAEQLVNPRGVAVDPRFGYLFWTDWGVGNSRVERSTLAGDDRVQIWKADGDGDGWPNGLTIDYMENRVYWADAKYDIIWSSKYDASDHVMAVQRVDWLTHPFGVTTFNDLVIWTDWRTTVIASANKWTGENSTVIELGYNPPLDVKVYHESRQPMFINDTSQAPNNPCLNHTCEGLCIPVPTATANHLTHKCSCPHFYKLSTDGVSCEKIQNFLLFSHFIEIQGMRLDNLNFSAIQALSSPDVGRATRLAHDWSHDRIYWPDSKSEEIKSSFINGSDVTTVVDTDSANVFGLVVDPLHKTIYWTSYIELSYAPNKKLINSYVMVASLDGRYKYQLGGPGWENVSRPKYLTSDVQHAMLYFTDDFGVYSVSMDGSNLQQISNYKNASDLRYHDNTLYCVHNGSVKVIETTLCGGFRCTRDLHIPATMIALWGERMWVYDDDKVSIFEVENFHSENPQRILKRNRTGKLADILIYHSTGNIQPQSRACTTGMNECEQLCLPSNTTTEVVASCKCSMGYKVDANNIKQCKAIEEFILYATDSSVRGIHLNGEEGALSPIMDQARPVGVDFFAKNNTILWTDSSAVAIKASTRDVTSQWTIYSPFPQQQEATSTTPVHMTRDRYEGIAVDWVAENVYWTDSGSDQIKVVRMNGLYVYTIYRGGQLLRSIALHPVAGLLFVTDWGTKAGIIRMKLDGTGVNWIATRLGWPNGITIDFGSDRLYYCDAQRDTIHSIDFNGNNRQLVYDEAQFRTYGIDFYNGKLYWSDSHHLRGSINVCEVTTQCTNSSIKWLAKGLSLQLKDMVIFSASRQNGTNVCAVNNGGCEELCFHVGNNVRRCACAHGVLTANNRSCQPHKQYIAYSESKLIQSINVDDLNDPNAPLPGIDNPDLMKSVIALAMDYKGHRMFYSDMTMRNIYSVNTTYNGRSISNPQLVARDVGPVEGLAYHKVEHALYWTSLVQRDIRRQLLNSTNIEIIVPEQDVNDRLRALVLYECARPNYIFWTNWNERNASVSRSTSSGRNIKSIISTKIKTPNALTIDIIVKQLYWADASLDKIERCDFDGGNRQVIISNGLDHIFSLAVLDKYLYWSDWGNRMILRANKWNGGALEIMRNRSYPHPLGVMAVYDDKCGRDPCDSASCKYRCVMLDDGSAACMCPDGVISDECGAHTVCTNDQFDCGEDQHLRCVAYIYTCDGTPHCSNGADETDIYCRTRSCRDGYWMCENDTCIDKRRVCDGLSDCDDGSDEDPDIQCPNSPSRLSRLPCSYGMFSCGDGKCIPLSWKCDSESDCDDGSDENCNHTCPLGHFQCSTSHKCIPLSYVCDADKDCFDGSDEANCSSKCREDFFSCVGTGHCIPDTWVCDGEVECPDGSDELSCDISCGADKFRCDNGNCISMAWKCDREFDCDDHSDEVGCSYGACKQSMLECKSDAECYMHEWKCDGDMDCSDGTDEMDCPPSPTSACPVDHIPCGNGSCITLSKACNNVSDCTDGADEKLCFVNECENKQSNRCQQLCINRDYSYKCGCRPGFQLSTDGYSCSEINECAHIVPPCSQICEKYPNTYECSCAPSYYRDPLNRRNCKAGSHTGEPYILFANEYFLRQLSLNGSNYSLRLAHLSHMTALDFDWSGQKLYWSDTTRSGSSIQRMNLNKTFHPSDFGPGSDQSGIETIHQSLQKVDGLAVDWIGRNIYWSERDKNTIEVSKLDGSFRKVLVRSGLEEPQAIALLPDKGYLYWSDWGSDPHIGKIGMDGTDRSVIIHNRILGQQTSHSWPGAALGWPNALTIDYAARKLFWADAKEGYIAHCDLDGANAAIVVQSPDNRDSRIFSISLFEDSIYWTDWSQTSIMTSYKFRSIHNTTNVHPIHKVVHIPMDLKVVHPLRQPMPASPHPCLINNGDCSDLCLLSPGGGKSCSCPENFILQKDGISCVQNCSFSEFVCKNHKCIPFWWKCDTVDDCGDYSDEPDHCRHFFCTPGMYQCANTTKYTNNSCISPSAICDGTPQCTDGSDELNCDHHVCLPTQFRCSHPPKCILRMFRCDGKKDCDQGEDEIGCAPVSCSSTEYECQPSPNNETSCIPSRWKCDGDVDCYHGDDETNCTVTTCMDSEMKCSNTGPCISKSWACDGENDCRDGSDELPSICGNKTCNSDHFMCGNGILCIPNSWVCDSDNDCGDNSDERNCTNTPCASGEISCTFTQQCVKKSAKCDGKYDCLDQSDELYCHVTCNKDQFRCEKPPLCIPLSYKCDGVPHCNNGTDEINCKGTASKCCSNATFTCMDGACIPHVWKCDGELDCPDGSDEGPVCSVFQCPPDRPYRCQTQDICLPLNKLCDGINNCGSHNDDETTSVCKAADTYAGHSANSTHCLLWRKHLGSRSGNPPNPVGEHGFVCSSGDCTPYSTLCDGVENCQDGSDEVGCFSGACNSQTNPCGFVIGSTCKPLPPTAKGGRYESYCSCEHGLQLKHGRFGLSCFDIDECSTFLPCSQSCTNVYKGFRCNCFPGWRKSDWVFCRMAPNPYAIPTLLIAPGIPQLLATYQNLESVVQPTESYVLPSYVKIDLMTAARDTVYFLDKRQNSIMSYKSNLTKKIGSLPTNSCISSISVDMISSTLYWTELHPPTMHVYHIPTAMSHVLYSHANWSVSWPLDVALCPFTGYMFVADGGATQKPATIWRYNMDGSSTDDVIKVNNAGWLVRTSPDDVIIVNDADWPSSVTVDYTANRLYWADRKKMSISSCKYDGSDRRLIKQFSEHQPLKISMFGDFIYGTTFHTNRVFRIHKMAHTITSTFHEWEFHSQGVRPGKPIFLPDNRNKLDWVLPNAPGTPLFSIINSIPKPALSELRHRYEISCENCAKNQICLAQPISGEKFPKPGKFRCVNVDHIDTNILCNGVECGGNKTCKNGVCICDGLCTGATSSQQPGVATTTILVVLIMCLCVVMVIGFFLWKKRSRWSGFKHSRMNQSQTSVGRLLYSELVALETDDNRSMTSLMTSSNGGTTNGDITSPETETTETAMNEDIGGSFDRIFYSKNLEDETSEQALLLRGQHLSEDSDPPHKEDEKSEKNPKTAPSV